jgi:hypothetical protein
MGRGGGGALILDQGGAVPLLWEVNYVLILPIQGASLKLLLFVGRISFPLI